MSDIKFIISVDSKKGTASIKQLDGSIDKLEKTTKKSAGGFKELALKIGVGIVAFRGAVRAVRGLIDFTGDAVELAGIQEQAEVDMTAALEVTGREVAANAEHFKEYASQLQEATVYGDEQILAAQALMIQLTKLDREGLDAATKGAIGLASVYKTDLKAATTLVGKALAGSYGALSRYGIMVKTTMTDEEKRISILDQLGVMYQRAEAETDTYAGSMKQLSNVAGDFKEVIGEAVTENESFREGIQLVTSIISDFVASGVMESWIGTVEQGFKTMAKASLPFQTNINLLKLIAANLAMAAADEKALREEGERLIWGFSKIDEWLVTIGADLQTILPFWQRTKKEIEGISITIPKLEMPEFDFPMLPSEIIAEDIRKINMVTETELNDLMISIEADAEEAAQSVLKSLGLLIPEVTTETKKAVDAWEEMFKGLTEGQKEFSKIAISEFIVMEASLKGAVEAILNTLEQWAIGEIVPLAIKSAPFPINLLITGGAVLAVKALFAGIKGKEAGGWVGEHGPEIIRVGERGREYVVSNAMTRNTNNIYNQGGSRVTHVHNHHIHVKIAEHEFRQIVATAVNKSGELREIKIPYQVVD